MGFNPNDYEPVEVRLARFWERYPEGTVQTELVYQDETRFIVKAAVFANRTNPYESLIATGFAEERVDSNPRRVNFSSALENCETSAVGRALANADFAPRGARPSREEMEKVARATSSTAIAEPETIHSALRRELNDFDSRADNRKALVLSVVGREIAALTELTADEVGRVREEIKTRTATKSQEA